MNDKSKSCGQELRTGQDAGGMERPNCGEATRDQGVGQMEFPAGVTAIMETVRMAGAAGRRSGSPAAKEPVGVISIEESVEADTGQPPALVLESAQKRKYRLGSVLAEGGMGMIREARDLNVRRSVAVKLMRDPGSARREEILRFIEEAQITGQLEHPGIVPVHELGLDSAGNVFYSMKLVRGRTLKAILHGIKTGDPEIVGEFSLARLLNVFQRACDAVAFAHARQVIHRDLKPENVMVGEFGEVMVMDWGLAKLLTGHERAGRPEQSSAGSSPADEQWPESAAGADRAANRNPIVSSRRQSDGDAIRTVAGKIMGTPQYMAPEQARGETGNIGEQTDIYALGAILYNILTLHPPITRTNVDAALKAATEGRIHHPSTYNRLARLKARRRAGRAEDGGKSDAPGGSGGAVTLVHCPGNRIPESLSAVAMKALALRPLDRYATVKDLQKDIEAYQNGFATSAEEASAWKHFRLFVRRHWVVSIVVGISSLALSSAIAVGYGVNLAKRLEIERTLRELRLTQLGRQSDRRSSAPALVHTAKIFIEQQDYESALPMAKRAAEYDPGLAEARLLHALILIRAGDYANAAEECRAAAAAKTGNADAREAMPIFATAQTHGATTTMLGGLADICGRMGVPTLGVEFAKSADERLALYREKLEKSWKGTGRMLNKDSRGRLGLAIRKGKSLQDISRLRGIPLNALDLSGSSVSDIAPLAGMPIGSLNLGSTQISNIWALKDLPLKQLDLSSSTFVSDLAPLEGMELEQLNVRRTHVMDISPLQGMPLQELNLESLKGLTDVSWLEGMPLRDLKLLGTGVSNLEAVAEFPLVRLSLPEHATNGIETIRGIATLEQINNAPAREFWKRWDAAARTRKK